MVLFDLDPETVKAGWMPLLIVVALGVVVVFLWRNMRHNISKITVPTAAEVAERRAAGTATPTEGAAPATRTVNPASGSSTA